MRGPDHLGPEQKYVSHLTADACHPTTLLVACILPVCALLVPGRAGASTPQKGKLLLLGPLAVCGRLRGARLLVVAGRRTLV